MPRILRHALAKAGFRALVVHRRYQNASQSSPASLGRVLMFDNAADESWEAAFTEDLTFRWAREGDVYGCIYCASLAYGSDETEECLSGYALRGAEYKCRSSWLGGFPSNWAICVDKSDNKSPIPAWKASEERKDWKESAYGKRVRDAVADAAERVVAVLCFERQYVHFGGQQPSTIGRIAILACLPPYRRKPGLIDGLFAMVHAKSRARGDAFTAVWGVASYYKRHGYEYVSRQTYEMKTPLHVALPAASAKSEYYNLRSGNPKDVDAILRIQRAQISTSDLFISCDNQEQQLAFALGAREPPFDAAEDLDRVGLDPVSVLEYKRKLVAAVEWTQHRGPNNAVTQRIYVDTRHGDLGQLAKELVARTIAAINAFWDDRDATKGYVESTIESKPKPKELYWRFGPGNPLIRHCLDQRLAYSIAAEDMVYASWRQQYFRLHSLATALKSMQSALTARLKAARDLLGSSITLDLGIAYYQSSIEGAVIRIKDSEVVEIAGKSFKHIDLSRGGQVDKFKEVQLAGNQLAMMHLIFGCSSLQECKRTFPDLQYAVGSGLLIEALFPRLAFGGHLYV